MLQEEVRVNESLIRDDGAWDEWGNMLVSWSLSIAIVVLIFTSFFINFFLV